MAASALRVVLTLVGLMHTTPIAAQSSRPCSDPCFQAAKAGFHDCVSSAQGAFVTALDGCLEHARTCLAACRSERQDCLDGTGLDEGYAACAADLEARKARCRLRFRDGSLRQAICINRAEIQGFRCRSEARRSFLQAVRGCDE